MGIFKRLKVIKDRQSGKIKIKTNQIMDRWGRKHEIINILSSNTLFIVEGGWVLIDQSSKQNKYNTHLHIFFHQQYK